MNALLTLAFMATVFVASGADWPQWRGPNRDGISGERLRKGWIENGLKEVWRAKVGTGFSGVSVSGGNAVTIGNEQDTDVIFCFEAATGRELWRYSYAAALGPQYYEGGPGATPILNDGRVYTISKWGDVFCLDQKTGRLIWQRDLKKEGIKTNRWGFAGSPLIWRELVIYNAGEAGTALDRKTGKVVWSNGTNATGYASPIRFHGAGEEQVLIFGAKHLIAIRSSDGREIWRFPWETGWDTNNPDPLVQDNKIFISSFTAGCALLSVKNQKPAAVYVSKSMFNHLSPGVLVDGYIYGFSGEAKHESDFRCLKYDSGEVQWSTKDVTMGSLIVVDNSLVVLSEKGELVIGDRSTKAWQPKFRQQILGGVCWTPPTFADGSLYARNAKGDLVCLRMGAPAKP